MNIFTLSTLTEISINKNISKIEFEVLGNNLDQWAEQFKNDLENLYINEGLMLIGGYNKIGSQSEFEFVMYKTLDRVNKTYKFDFEIDTFYGKMREDEFKQYLNKKYINERMVYVSSFVVNRKFDLNEIYDETNFQMRLIVFQNLKINFSDFDDQLNFTVKPFPSLIKETEKEIKLMRNINLEYEMNNLEFIGILPSHSTFDSYLIYWNWDEENDII